MYINLINLYGVENKMGTRSTTKFYEDGNHILSVYKQWDGYVTDGWGDELKKFICSGRFVNGIGDRKIRQFNGFGCFILQLIAKYKEGAGDLYAKTKDCGSEEYNYRIEFTEDWEDGKGIVKRKIKISCEEDASFEETIDLMDNSYLNREEFDKLPEVEE